MKTFAFSLSSKRVALSSAAALGVATLACPLQALAQNASINAIQLSVEVAPITVSGTRLGGSTSASGVGLTTGTLPTLDNTGATATTATPFTAAAGTSGGLVGGDFGSQTGRFSAASAGATMAITGANAATIDAGTGIGTTATATISSTVSSDANQAQIRRVATSTNGQSTFTAERQGARYQHGGSGLAAVTAGGILGTAAVGINPAITVSAGGATPEAAGVAFIRTEAVQTGQASTTLNTAGNVPGYGTVTQTVVSGTGGDITVGTAGAAGINSLTVAPSGMGAGNSATLSVIQSLTAF